MSGRSTVSVLCDCCGSVIEVDLRAIGSRVVEKPTTAEERE